MVLSSFPRRQVADPHHIPSIAFTYHDNTDPAWDRPILKAVRHFLRQWTAPEMLIGMGLGQIGWGAGRLLGLRGALWAQLEGRAGLWAARSAGVLAEGATWTAVAQLGGRLRSGTWQERSAITREWATTSTLAAILRSSQGIFGRSGPWGMALGTYGGLVLSQRTLAWAGLDRVKPWTQTLGESAALYVDFHLGGLAAQRLWGPALGAMDRIFNQMVQRLQSHLDHSGANSTLLELNGWGARVPALPGGQSLPPNCVAMGSDPSGPPNGGRRPFSSKPGAERRPSEPAGGAERPWRALEMLDILNDIQRSISRFGERIRKDHVHYLLPSQHGYVPEKVLDALNGLSYLEHIPGGRKVEIRFEDNPSVRNELIKFGSVFRLRGGSRTTPPGTAVVPVEHFPTPSSSISDTATAMENVRLRMDNITSRRPRTIPPRPSSSSSLRAIIPNLSTDPATPTALASQPPLRLVANVDELAAYIRGLQQSSIANGIQGIEGDVLVNQSKLLEIAELDQVNRLAMGFSNESRIGVHDPQRRRSFQFHKDLLKVRGESVPWSPPKDFDRFEASDLLEALQKLSFIRGRSDPRGEPLHIRILGKWRPYQDDIEMEKFLNIQTPFPQRPIRILQQSNKQDFTFSIATGKWTKGRWQ